MTIGISESFFLFSSVPSLRLRDHFAVQRLEMPLLFGKITAAGLVMLWNYFARVATVYKKEN